MKRATLLTGFFLFCALPLRAESVDISTPVVAVSTPAVEVSTPVVATDVSTNTFTAQTSTEPAVIEKVSIDDSGNQLIVLIHTSQPVQCFLFERQDPPSLFVQFLSTPVFASGTPIQVVGIDPLSEVRYGFSSFHDATSGARDPKQKFQIDYIELKLTRPVFHSVQQQGWVVAVRLDRTTTKVEIPELDFRFDEAKYEGASNLPPDPRINDFVSVAQANSRLLSVSREEVTLAKSRVWEAQRALWPALTARASKTDGKEVNPFPNDAVEGFETTTYKREEYGLQATQPIWQSGRLFNAYKQAKINRAMATENVRKQAQDLTFEVKKAYFTLMKNQTTRRVRSELVAQGESLKELAKKKQDLQLASKAEVLNVNAQADQASYQLVGDEQDISLARLVLISLTNQSDPLPDPVPGALSFGRLSFNVESIINWAQEHRPDVRIARMNAELTRLYWKAQQADNGVKLDASGFYGKAGAAFAGDDFQLDNAWNFGFKLSKAFWGNTARANYTKEKTAPDLGQSFVTDSQQRSVELGIMDSVAGISNAKQAELQYQKAKAELVEASRKAEYEVRESYYNLEKSARQLEAVRQDLTFKQKDLEITREKVKLGLSELSQLMAAEVAHTQALVSEQDALAAYNISLAAMDRVAGAEVVRE